MAIRLWERLMTLVKADAHGVVGAIEDRSLILKQVLREAELALLQRRARLDALQDERASLQESQDALEKEKRDLDRDVTLALEQDEGDLSRFAVRRLLVVQRNLETVCARLREIEKEYSTQTEMAVEGERTLEELRARVRVTRVRPLPHVTMDEFSEHGVAEEEIDLELLRRRTQVKEV